MLGNAEGSQVQYAPQDLREGHKYKEFVRRFFNIFLDNHSQLL